MVPQASRHQWLVLELRAPRRRVGVALPRGDGERSPIGPLTSKLSANVKALQRALGHEKASVTLDVYADLFEDDLDNVAERLDWKVRSLTTSDNFTPANSNVHPTAYDDPM